MPRICEQCGEEHLTQEEIEEQARKLRKRGDEASPEAEPLPHEFWPGEAPETISEKFAPKRTSVKRQKNTI
jgi:hypothetical protein